MVERIRTFNLDNLDLAVKARVEVSLPATNPLRIRTFPGVLKRREGGLRLGRCSPLVADLAGGHR